MKTVKIKILAEDILTTDYEHSKNCAITRALQRAGVNARDVGGGEIYSNSDFLEYKYLGCLKEEDNDKVLGMYAFCSYYPHTFTRTASGYEDILVTPIKPEDFEIEVDLDI